MNEKMFWMERGKKR